MIAVDTNIIVRLLTQDDPDQYQKSLHIFSTQEIFVPDTVVLEVEWVLRYAYHFKPPAIIKAFRKLFGLPNIQLRDKTTIELAVEWYEKGLAFADAFHLAQAQHCQKLLTFDQGFVKRSAAISSCPVQLPK